MRIHVFRPDYGEAGFTLPCPACGHGYDPGNWYFARPCPRCGLDTNEDCLPWWVHSVVRGLCHRFDLPATKVREELGAILHISIYTFKRWEYHHCSRKNWQRFAKAVQVFLNRREPCNE